MDPVSSSLVNAAPAGDDLQKIPWIMLMADNYMKMKGKAPTVELGQKQ